MLIAQITVNSRYLYTVDVYEHEPDISDVHLLIFKFTVLTSHVKTIPGLLDALGVESMDICCLLPGVFPQTLAALKRALSPRLERFALRQEKFW